MPLFTLIYKRTAKDLRVFYKKHFPQKKKHQSEIKWSENGLLYTNIVGELLEMYLPSVAQDFRVFCDQRKLSGMTTKEFKRNVKARVLPNLSKNPIVQIEMVDSASSINIQIADWISGAIARYLEKGRLGEECYSILKENIIGKGKELFNNFSVED